MWDGFNQRKFPRIGLKCEINIDVPDSQEHITAKTENVGIGGVCILQKVPIERFSTCQIKLSLNDQVAPIECKGKVCWIIANHNPLTEKTLYDTGIEFVDLPKEERERLESFIKEFTDEGFQDLV